MKRGIFLIFLTLILLLPCISAMASADVEKTELLEITGIFDKTDMAYITSDRSVTRTQFVHYIMRLLNVSDQLQVDCTFWDVSKSNPNYYDIGAAQSMGLVGGYLDGSFAPYSNISCDEVVSILCNALGYSSYAEGKGGYPFGYYSVANEIKLLSGVDLNGSVVTWRQVAILLTNALKAPLMEQSVYTTNGINKFINTSKETLLSEKFDIYFIEGVVSTVGTSSIIYGSNLGEGFTCIDGKILIDKNNLATSLLGYNVRCYYHIKDDGDTGDIVVLYPLSNDDLVIMSDDINGFTDNCLRYFDQSDKAKSVDFKSGMVFAYNGKAIDYVNDFGEQLFDIDKGKIIFIDNDDDGSYNVALIYSYFNIVVNYYNPETNVIYDKYNNGFNVTLDDKNYTLRNTFGVDVVPSELKEYDIITVARSVDGELLNMVACFDKISGIISESVEENNCVISVIVNGEEYTLSNELSDRLNSPPSTDGAELYLNKDGKVVDIVFKDTTGFRLGLVVDIEMKSNLSSNALVGILTTRGKDMEVFELAEKVTVDGQSGFNGAEVKILLENCIQSSAAIIIRFLCNDKNEIIEIDTPIQGEKEGYETLVLKWSMDDDILQWKSNERLLGRHWFADEDALYFNVPDDITNASDVVMLENLLNDEKYNADVYLVGADSIVFNVVVIKRNLDSSPTPISDTTFPVIVDNITYGVDEDGENVHILYFYSGTERRSLPIDDSYYSTILTFGIDTGDIIRYGTNEYEKINQIEYLYDYSEKISKATSNPYTVGGATFFVGTVYKCEDNLIRLCINLNDPSEKNMVVAKVANYIYSANIRNKGIKISPAVASEIIDYKTGRSDAYKVLLYSKYDEPKYILFVK